LATIAAVIASTHHPFYYRASTAPPEQRPPFAAEWIAKITAFRETLTRARPDVLVMVGSDHFHQLWLDNMPQFLVGHAEQYDANWYNEEREFGLPRMLLPGQRDLSWHILRQGLDAGFDLAFSNELRVDHSITCPIIESWPSELRVAIIGTGHLSLELGGPRQFGPHGPDPEFDARAVEWIAGGDIDGCLAEVTLDSLHEPGNATHGFMDFMLMMGVAGQGQRADYVETVDLFHTMEAYFTWYPNGVPA
jgi:protocatechuate 4,5-dioxygenase beta chain